MIKESYKEETIIVSLTQFVSFLSDSLESKLKSQCRLSSAVCWMSLRLFYAKLLQASHESRTRTEGPGYNVAQKCQVGGALHVLRSRSSVAAKGLQLAFEKASESRERLYPGEKSRAKRTPFLSASRACCCHDHTHVLRTRYRNVNLLLQIKEPRKNRVVSGIKISKISGKCWLVRPQFHCGDNVNTKNRRYREFVV